MLVRSNESSFDLSVVVGSIACPRQYSIKVIRERESLFEACFNVYSIAYIMLMVSEIYQSVPKFVALGEVLDDQVVWGRLNPST